MIKNSREIKAAVLAIVSLFLLYYGFNYLKGVNLFKPVHVYHGLYSNVNGLTEQAPVYVKGFKVGQVDHITYDFSRDSSFRVDISINKDISLPYGTTMALIADGLLGGTAVQLNVPVAADKTPVYAADEYLPTMVIPGLMESLESGLISRIGQAVNDIDSLVVNINSQISDDHLRDILANVDAMSSDLTSVSTDLKRIMRNDVPGIVANADSAIANVNAIAANLSTADLAGTVSRVDGAVDNLNGILADVRDEKGTIGQLLYNKSLYAHIDSTIVSVDSLVTDLKAHPKRYVHFSIFGKKDK